MRLTIFWGMKEMLRCGSKLGGSRSARRRIPPYFGCSPAPVPWAQAIEPLRAGSSTSTLAMAAKRVTVAGMCSRRFGCVMQDLLCDACVGVRPAGSPLLLHPRGDQPVDHGKSDLWGRSLEVRLMGVIVESYGNIDVVRLVHDIALDIVD